MLENIILLLAMFIPLTIGIVIVIVQSAREKINQRYADRQKMKRDRWKV